MICHRLAIILLLGVLIPPVAQVNEWPGELSLPSPAAPVDSTGTSVVARQALYGKSFKSRNEVSWQQSDSARYAHQGAALDATFEKGKYVKVQNEYLSLPGGVERKQYPFTQGTVGVGWVPVLKLNTRDSIGTGSEIPGVFLGDLDVGPYVGLPLWGVPLRIGVGAAARAWNTGVAYGLVGTPGSDFSGAGGFYGNFEAGQWGQPLGTLPLYFSGRGYGRSLGSTAQFIGGMGSAVFAHGLATADSFFVAVSDTVLNGDNAVLGENGRGFTPINTPSMLDHTVHLLSGVRFRPRFHFVPGIAYGYSQHSREYPGMRTYYGDVRKNSAHGLQMLLHADSSFFLTYKGGIRFEWGKEDWLFDRRPDTITEIHVDLNDNDIYTASITHSLSKYLRNGMGASYEYSITRRSRTYTARDTLRNLTGHLDTLRSYDDRDEIIQEHRGRILMLAMPQCSVEVFGGGGVSQWHYLAAQKSAQSMTERVYRIGERVVWNPGDRVRLEQTGDALAHAGEYEYAQYISEHPAGQTPLNYPPYGRRFHAESALAWILTPALTANVVAGGQYGDEGDWVGRYYARADSADESRREYYGPTSRNLDLRFSVAPSVKLWNSVNVEPGCELRYTRSEAFDDIQRTYLIDKDGRGLWTIPFLKVQDRGEDAPWRVDGLIRVTADLKRWYVTTQDWEWRLTLYVLF